MRCQHGGGAARGEDREAEVDQIARHLHGGELVAVAHADEGLALGRQLDAGGELRLDERFAEGLADTHHFAGGLHLGAEDRVDARETGEREDRFLD